MDSQTADEGIDLSNPKPITLEEFSQRFVDRMVRHSDISEISVGVSVREYAEKAAPAYWIEAREQRVTPEECADEDMSYWGQ